MKTCVALTPRRTQFAPLLFAGDLQHGMERAAELGYDGVELNLRDPEELDQEAILSWSRELDLEVPSIGTGQSYFVDGLSLAVPDPANQAAVRRRLEGLIRFAARLGAQVVLGSIRGSLDASSDEARQTGYRAAVEASRELADYASGHGVSLTVEPINRYETNFLNTIAETLEFIDTVGAPNLGLLADTFHMNIEEASMTEPLIAAGNRLWHVHLVDSNRCAPGMGHTDFAPIVSALVAAGYSGYLSGEVLPVPDDETAAAHWIQAVRRLCST
jgi:sugar phosphate isomerase/epimerase